MPRTSTPRDVFLIADTRMQQVFAPAVENAFAGARLHCTKTFDGGERKAELVRAVDLALIEVVRAEKSVEPIPRFGAQFPDVPVIAISTDVDRRSVGAALKAGVVGYIAKATARSVIVAALNFVAAGGIYVPPEVCVEGDERSDERETLADQLTERKRDVLRLLLKGRSNSRIAAELSITEGTVKQHIHSIYKTIGVSSRAELMARAAQGRIRRDGSPITLDV